MGGVVGNPGNRTKNRGHRPARQLDEKVIENSASIGCTNYEMATILGTSTDTLERRYMAVMERGRARGRETLRRMQWHVAMEPGKSQAAMLIWLGKQMLGQREPREDPLPQVDLAGAIKELAAKLPD